MPQKGKISAEEKVRIVESYLSGKIGCSEAGRQAGVNDRTIAQWAIRYKSEGPSGFLPSTHNKTYSKETKLAAILDYQSGRGTMLERSGSP